MGTRPAVVLAALVAVVALSGCVQVQRMPTTPISDAEYTVIQRSYSDDVWAATGLPDELRPPAGPITFVSAENWSVTYVDCMNALGFDNYRANGTGVVIEQPDGGPGEEEKVAAFTCNESIAVRAEDTGMLSTAQLQFTYDYFAETLVPCLLLHGAQLDTVLTREEFLLSPYGWNPYWEIYDGDWNKIMADTKLRAECPPDPPGTPRPQFVD